MTKFKNVLIKLINESGGKVVDNLFVLKPGVKILEKTESTKFGILNFKNQPKNYIKTLNLIQPKMKKKTIYQQASLKED
jgi:hypothetical protein